jgi:TolA-binding protein
LTLVSAFCYRSEGFFQQKSGVCPVMAKRLRQRSAQPEHPTYRQTGPTKVAEASLIPASVAPSPDRPSAEAVSLFERAMQTLQRHEYSDAADVFRGLISNYPREGALCERELSRRPIEPRTTEERLTAATAALNNGDDDRAASLAQAVLSDAPQHDLALYLLAAVQARRGATAEALLFLGRAMAVNPEIRAQARHDEDFEDLRDIEAFRDLLDAPVPPTSEGPRRSRRNR